MYETFLTYIRCELNRSAHTVLSYRSDLELWKAFTAEHFGPEFNPLDTTLNDVRMWVASQAAAGISPRSIKRRISMLRTFFNFLVDRHGMKSNPALDLQTARAPRTLPNVIRPEESAKILDAPFDRDDFTEVRDRLILLTLYSTGMRASELTGLTDANVDVARGELKVLGKRNKERIIPFGTEMTRMINLYRSLRPAGDSAAFFTDTTGHPLTYRKLWATVRGQLAGRVKASRPTPHALRHSFATDMLNGGASLTAVQRLLGHASLATTQIYTHLSYTELQNNYQLAHPRAQKKG